MSKKLLLADDSVVIQKLVGLSFANEDIEIVSTDNGDDAIVQAREIQPDIVLADVVMPGLSGYEVCEAIKQDPALAHTPVLLLTGTFEAFDEGRAASAGANGQITKPFEAQALVERVKEVMNAPPVAVEPTPPSPSKAAAAPATADPFASANDNFDLAGDDTVIAPLPPVSNDISEPTDDLFDSSVSSLSDLDEPPSLDDDLSLDLTPNLPPSAPAFPATADANEETASGLFGAPGEGGSDDLDTEGGTMAIGQAMAPETAKSNPSAPAASAQKSAPSGPDLAENDATVAMMPDIAPLRSTPADASSRASDPLADLGEDLGANERPSDPPRLPDARPLDFDSALDGAANEGEPTILAPVDDVNASTSPNLSDPLADRQGIDRLEVHAPSADIDSTAAAGHSPEALGIDLDAAPESAVADLDASLDAGPEPIVPVVAESSLDRTPHYDELDEASDELDGTSGELDEASDVAPATREPSPAPVDIDGPNPDPLGFSPSNVAAEELDFAFDVSEQVAAENASETSEVSPATGPDTRNAYEDSFSSLMDISESQILGSARAAREPAAETIVAGYDVSSSDLATAEDSFSRGAEESSMPIPEPERLDQLPELPAAHDPAPPAVPVTGSEDLFDGLATGSALDEIEPQSDFSSASDLRADQDLLDEELGRPIPNDEPLIEVPELDSSAASDELEPSLEPEPTHADESSVSAEESESSLADDASDSTSAIPSPFSQDVQDAFQIGAAPIDSAPGDDANTSDENQRIPDLSPMMEQQIQETLEKVAWEAFSDLSESIVKQVMQRVEQIAWEVIPEMAETLVREEIRKMKGEED